MLKKEQIKKDYNLKSLPTIELSPEESDRFIDCIVDESKMDEYARVIKMNRPQKDIDAIGFGEGRFLVPSDAMNESKYKKQFSHNRINLDTEESMGALAVFDSDLEDVAHIENPNQYKKHLMSIVTRKIANELEEVYYMGDTHGVNDFCDDDLRGRYDGWRYIINHSQQGDAYYNEVCGAANILEACTCSGVSGCSLDFDIPGKIAEQQTTAPYNWEFKYHKMLKTMPSKYKNQGLDKFVFLNSDLVTQDYFEALSARSTGIGDNIFLGKMTPQYGRVPIVDIPLMPTNLGDPAAGEDGVIGAGEYTDVILTPKQNLVIGIQRKIKMEYWRYPPDQATYIFYTLRSAVAVENVNAIVFLRCLEHEC